MTRVFSGIQPTGSLHLGNYLGAIKNWVALQDRPGHECLYCVVDYHAITIEYEPAAFADRTVEMARDLLACGLDPERSILFAQSQVPEHTELAWIFQATSTSYGELQRMTQFKAKSGQHDFVTAGLFTYPVLQAADILLYDASRVPVGEDQVQHLELAREIGRRFNLRFGETFPEVQPLLTRAPRILSLRDPEQKMSKSAGEGHYLSLDGTEKEIRDMVKRAVTDVGPQPEGRMSPGVANLFTILKELGEDETWASLSADYEAGRLRYVDLKGAVSDAVWTAAAGIQARKAALPPDAVRDILRAGGERARPMARTKIAEVRKRVGLVEV
jgi:tryptophanyl-tRNA synthetase